MIRVESDETQNYVREGKSTELEDEEERTFVASAVSVRKTHPSSSWFTVLCASEKINDLCSPRLDMTFSYSS